MAYLFECRDCWYNNETIDRQPLAVQLAAVATLQRATKSLWGGVTAGVDPRDRYRIFSGYQLRPLLDIALRWSPPALVVRGAFASQELLAEALRFEPISTQSFASALAKSLTRWQLLNAAADSKGLLSWTAHPTRLLGALTQTIRSDPSPYVRLEALRALGASPVPISWIGPLLESIRGAEAVLAETPFKQDERQALAKYLAEVTGKLQAAAVPSFPAELVPGISEPVTTLDLRLPSINPAKRRWVPWALGGLNLAGLIGLGVWAHRRSGERSTQAALDAGLDGVDQYRSLPPDPGRSSPVHELGPIHAHSVGTYWTVPADVPLVDLAPARAKAISRERLASVRAARQSDVALPPIEISVARNGSMMIIDGNHRLVAARRAKAVAIPVQFTFVGQ